MQTDSQLIQKDKHCQSSNLQSPHHTSSLQQPDPSDPPSQTSDTSSPDNASSPVAALRPTDLSHDSSYSVSINDKFAVLDADGSPLTSQPSQHTSTTVRTNKQALPSTYTKTVSVADKATALIGDFVIRNIQTHNFPAPTEAVQRICTS